MGLSDVSSSSQLVRGASTLARGDDGRISRLQGVNQSSYSTLENFSVAGSFGKRDKGQGICVVVFPRQLLSLVANVLLLK
jgi:hypothetical protein